MPYAEATETAHVRRPAGRPMTFYVYDTRTGAYRGVVATKPSAHEAKAYAAELYSMPIEFVDVKLEQVHAAPLKPRRKRA